jgi:hypothetical protein
MRKYLKFIDAVRTTAYGVSFCILATVCYSMMYRLGSLESRVHQLEDAKYQQFLKEEMEKVPGPMLLPPKRGRDPLARR